MKDDLRQEILYLFDKIEKQLFMLEQKIEENENISNDKWKDYRNNIHKIWILINRIKEYI